MNSLQRRTSCHASGKAQMPSSPRSSVRRANPAEALGFASWAASNVAAGAQTFTMLAGLQALSDWTPVCAVLLLAWAYLPQSLLEQLGLGFLPDK